MRGNHHVGVGFFQSPTHRMATLKPNLRTAAHHSLPQQSVCVSTCIRVQTAADMAAAKGDAKDPAYAASERLAVLLTKCNRDAILKQLEPNALFQGLTGVVSGAGAVALHLVQFASNAGNSLVVEETYSYKDMKTASTVLRVHDLRVEDTIAINHSLLITKITRRRIASRLGATEQSKQLTRAFMRSLLEGPPMRPTTRYPVLDFSYRHIVCTNRTPSPFPVAPPPPHSTSFHPTHTASFCRIASATCSLCNLASASGRCLPAGVF